MAFKFFVVPDRGSANAEQELNRFLASHKVLSIDRELIDQGMNSFWAICVDYLNSTVVENTGVSNLSRSRVDYKTILAPQEFEEVPRQRPPQATVCHSTRGGHSQSNDSSAVSA